MVIKQLTALVFVLLLGLPSVSLAQFFNPPPDRTPTGTGPIHVIAKAGGSIGNQTVWRCFSSLEEAITFCESVEPPPVVGGDNILSNFLNKTARFASDRSCPITIQCYWEFSLPGFTLNSICVPFDWEVARDFCTEEND